MNARPDADALDLLVRSLDARAAIACGEAAVEPALALMRGAAVWMIEAGFPMWVPSQITRERVLGEAGPECCWCLRIEGEPAAAAMLTWDDPVYWPGVATGTSGFIHKLALGTRWHGQGLGRTMIAALEGICLLRGVSLLRLDCAADRPALVRISEGAGFVRVDRRVGWMGDSTPPSTSRRCNQQGDVAWPATDPQPKVK